MVPAHFNYLTSKQKKVYSAIESYVKSRGIPPTVREIGELIGEKTPGAVQGILNRLEQKGVIKRQIGMARSIQLISDNSQYADPIYIPELKKISKRNVDDLLNLYNIIKYQPLPADLLQPGKIYFMVLNPDNSLFESEESDEEKLVISLGSELKNEDMALVLYENLVLLRKYFETDQTDTICLKSDKSLIPREIFNKNEIVMIGRLEARLKKY